ncbi:sigma-70 family RNA polymerase sigma factor (plasmid) [Cetobacterium somerae]|uniref:sigma-70 family RNA polymerase sigma factor n=1 Tax=Cetobacterium somerae TaxID=188913 RepID=UPI002E7B787C|nr:sigma-70 family RNA polymerase sigma factor [Cetobacterium somerae]WVJ03019.1 sigma-70 family RNA polymerase sigma factor [Cetobacterium somerae]
MILINENLKHDLLTLEEENRLLVDYKINGNEEALETLVEYNQRLIAKNISILNAYNKETFEDLIQEGNIGLITAIRRFSLDSDYRLSTYATHWIKHMILRYLKSKNDNIRIPEYQHNILTLYKKGASIEQISKSTSASAKRIKKIISDFDNGLYAEHYFLEAFYSNIPESPNIEEEIISSLMEKELCDLIASKLSKKEAQFVIHKFGINAPELTEMEMSIKFNCSKQNINSTYRKGLEKLKKEFIKNEKFNKRSCNNKCSSINSTVF